MVKTLEFCTLTFSEYYVICVVHKNVFLNLEKSKIQKKVILDYYKDRPFVYITHRIYSYKVDPKSYLMSSKIKTLAGVAVVTNSISNIKKALIDKMFFKKQIQIFDNLDDAILWAEQIYNMKMGL